MIIIKKFILLNKVIIFIVLLSILSHIFYIFHNYHQLFLDKLNTKTTIIIEGPSAPRGKIFDKNGNVLVDNKMINNLVFYNLKGLDKEKIAEKLSQLLIFDTPTEKEIINWYKNTHDVNRLFSIKEKDLIDKRKISPKGQDELLNERIKSIIDNLSAKEKKIAKVYNLLNNGYTYAPKVILKNITDKEVNLIIEEDIPGIKIESSFERYYPYGETLKGIFGTIGKITEENKDEYLDKGYNLDDIVGTSNLEKYYDNYLQGKKAKYKVESDNSLSLISKEEKGNDLYLSIDITIQQKVDEIVEKNLIKAKKYPNTNYLSDSYVIISNPKTGEISAISGKRYLSNGEFNDIVINNISSSFTMGSVVKGATISVGYQNGLINPNEKIYDSCIKLKHLTRKCSWKELGYLNSVTALEQSSNYYQFLLAIKLTGLNYYPNMDLPVSSKEFNIYRKMLASYGLGIKTGIDLPNEKIGLIGNIISPDLLLNLAIGQYDTYTPIELLTYINTLANNGQRHKPSLVTKIMNSDNLLYKNNYEIVDNVDIKESDMALIHEGFYLVMNRGTGNGFMNKSLLPAGKTGTSESFLDTNDDGKIDTATLTLTLAGYFPYDDPKYSLVIVCPSASWRNEQYDYIYYITSHISREITDFMFENVVIP